MKTIKAQISIDASPEQVWQVLVDFSSYSSWNPFITSIKGYAKEGEYLNVTIESKPGSKMNFKPEILVLTPNEELRWKGKLFIKGLFDGEHYFILERQANGSTQFKHGEVFTGLLVKPLISIIGTETEKGFNAMNASLKAFCETRVEEVRHVC